MIQICYICRCDLISQKAILIRLFRLALEFVESKLFGLALDLRFFCSLRPLSRLLDRRDWGLVVLCSDIGGPLRAFSTESLVTAGAGSFGFNEPGLRISKPDPWPRRTCGSVLISNDDRFRGDIVTAGGKLSAAAPSEAGMIGLDGGVS